MLQRYVDLKKSCSFLLINSFTEINMLYESASIATIIYLDTYSLFNLIFIVIAKNAAVRGSKQGTDLTLKLPAAITRYFLSCSYNKVAFFSNIKIKTTIS